MATRTYSLTEYGEYTVKVRSADTTTYPTSYTSSSVIYGREIPESTHNIKFGGLGEVNNILIGQDNVEKIYIGNNVVYTASNRYLDNGYKYTFNTTLTSLTTSESTLLNFISDSSNYGSISYTLSGSGGTLKYGGITVYMNNSWVSSSYKTIYITDMLDKQYKIFPESFLSWFEANTTRTPISSTDKFMQLTQPSVISFPSMSNIIYDGASSQAEIDYVVARLSLAAASASHNLYIRYPIRYDPDGNSFIPFQLMVLSSMFNVTYPFMTPGVTDSRMYVCDVTSFDAEPNISYYEYFENEGIFCNTLNAARNNQPSTSALLNIINCISNGEDIVSNITLELKFIANENSIYSDSEWTTPVSIGTLVSADNFSGIGNLNVQFITETAGIGYSDIYTNSMHPLAYLGFAVYPSDTASYISIFTFPMPSDYTLTQIGQPSFTCYEATKFVYGWIKPCIITDYYSGYHESPHIVCYSDNMTYYVDYPYNTTQITNQEQIYTLVEANNYWVNSDYDEGRNIIFDFNDN